MRCLVQVEQTIALSSMLLVACRCIDASFVGVLLSVQVDRALSELTQAMSSSTNMQQNKQGECAAGQRA